VNDRVFNGHTNRGLYLAVSPDGETIVTVQETSISDEGKEKVDYAIQ